MVTFIEETADDITSEFLPTVARCVAEWFPSLKGRAVALTEADINASNRPTLPFALVAPNRTDTVAAQADSRVTGTTIGMQDDFIIELWYPVERFTINSDKANDPSIEKPFWAYYPYEKIRDYLITKMYRESAQPGRESWGISFVSLDIDADPQAVVLTFRFMRSYKWCPLADVDDEPEPITLTFETCIKQCRTQDNADHG